MKEYDYLIVGSGLFGATFAYFAHKQGKRCLVIDKRPQLGGNVYCKDVGGIHVHQYGAHIFHTSNKKVWDFVNALVPFNRYTNSPVANYQGKLYNLPFNMNTFYQMWGVTTPAQAQAKLDEERAEMRARLDAEGVKEPRNLEEQAQLLIGKSVYERLIKGYTEKQWGRKCTDLPAFIIKRLPVRLVFDNNYFNDSFQGIPIGGYNKLIEALLAGVETRVNTDYFSDRKAFDALADKIVYTGQLDEFFDYQYGHLNFRTVRFETEVLGEPNHQGNAVVNYTEATVPYTRVIEHKHFESFGQAVYDNPKTVISREYSTEWKPGMEPYYPVNDEKNNELAEKYRALAARQENVIFGGRLAEYKYYDMAPVIEKVMKMFELNCGQNRNE
ncbi:UDP-galactopyranose mutase [Prevotella sp. AGR2160]|uniref:UDP-galactopyranose mutase n=1 Tax=Prevotella sp. AGR2160 TaxID=1280674 RepID=UPI00041886E4|nr:UDP-galactopyranose mutase [Prevotella sp. AGR2160]